MRELAATVDEAVGLTRMLEAERRSLETGDWVDVCAVEDIPVDRARTFTISGERVAVFKYEGMISALSNLCQHQNGPLGEGRIIDGFVTCPWHGYQYVPRCGRSPEPFTERVPTFRSEVRDGRVFIDPQPLAAGSDVEPARIA